MMERITDRGEPCGNPIDRFLGADSKSPKEIVLERLER